MSPQTITVPTNTAKKIVFDPFDVCNEPTLRDAANVRMRATPEHGLLIEVCRPQRNKAWRSYKVNDMKSASHKRLMNILYNRHWNKFVSTRAATFWNTYE